MNLKKPCLSLSHPGSSPPWHGTSHHRWLRLLRRHQRVPSEKKNHKTEAFKNQIKISMRKVVSVRGGRELRGDGNQTQMPSVLFRIKGNADKWCYRPNQFCLVLTNSSFKKIQVPGRHPKAVESKPLGMEPKNLYVFKVHQMMGVHSSLEPWLFKTHRHTLSCPIRSWQRSWSGDRLQGPLRPCLVWGTKLSIKCLGTEEQQFSVSKP